MCANKVEMEGKVVTASDISERVRQIITTDSSFVSQDDVVSVQYEWDKFTHRQDVSNNLICRYTPQERQLLIDEKCDEFFEATNDPKTHFTHLDRSFSSLLKCKWQPLDALLQQRIIDEACRYISRLPSVSMQLPADIGALSQEFFSGPTKAWRKLHVVSRLATNTIRFVLTFVICENGVVGWVDGFAQTALNHVGEFIDTTVRKAQIATSESDRQRWFIVRSYMWTFWQLCRSFYASVKLNEALRSDRGYHQDSYLWFRNFDLSEGLSLRELTEISSKKRKPENLCSWTLELLRSDLHCLGLDFDLLHERYRSLLGGAPRRCSSDGKTSCDGLHPDHCLRYRGLKVKDQSMHDYTCFYGNADEPKLTWNKESYMSVSGARAVSVVETEVSAGQLIYCSASDRTIAISHVWSHGQGGRPHDGINICLHQRYCRIALELGCESYWMDTTCIPEDHELRKEAIDNINDVFYHSHAVLICDKDLMTIDVSNPDTQLYESILCAVLLCDWNSRAWTVLEGLKGRRNTYILCKDNRVLNFKRVVKSVCDNGSMSILPFAHQIVHIMPWNVERFDLLPLQKQLGSDKIRIEITGSWLSHRPASRKGDNIVIWSLLPGHGAILTHNAVDFWRKQANVYTGFLLSSAKRLKSKGLTWAPKTPYAIPDTNRRRMSNIYHRPSPSQETYLAKIDENGITAEWYIHWFGAEVSGLQRKIRSLDFSKRTATEAELSKILWKFIHVGQIGAVLYPSNLTMTPFPGQLPPVPSEEQNGILLAVCETDQKEKRKCTEPGRSQLWSYRYVWRGVYQWPRHIPLPAFERDPFVWIS